MNDEKLVSYLTGCFYIVLNAAAVLFALVSYIPVHEDPLGGPDRPIVEDPDILPVMVMAQFIAIVLGVAAWFLRWRSKLAVIVLLCVIAVSLYRLPRLWSLMPS